jgi:hypothetical protein
VDGFQHKGVLREEEGSLGVYAEEQQGVYRVDDLLAHIALETHYQMLYLRHHGIQFGALQI